MRLAVRLTRATARPLKTERFLVYGDPQDGCGHDANSEGATDAGNERRNGLIDNPTQSMDWRAETLDRVRGLIKEAAPEAIEERKWVKPSNPAGVPTWSQAGIICTGETYKAVVKLTFARGASVPDPAGLFNSSLEGAVRRAIDIREGETFDEQAFKKLIREAVTLNESTAGPRSERDPL